MSKRELAVNQELRALDEAHRLGRVSRAEYRSRRRQLIGTLRDSSGVVTARNALASPVPAPAPRAGAYHASEADSAHALNSLLSMRPAIAWKSWIALAAALLLLILLGYWLLQGG
jgi:hypothetical protein